MSGDEGSKHRFGAFPAAEVLAEIVAVHADASVKICPLRPTPETHLSQTLA